VLARKADEITALGARGFVPLSFFRLEWKETHMFPFLFPLFPFFSQIGSEHGTTSPHASDDAVFFSPPLRSFPPHRGSGPFLMSSPPPSPTRPDRPKLTVVDCLFSLGALPRFWRWNGNSPPPLFPPRQQAARRSFPSGPLFSLPQTSGKYKRSTSLPPSLSPPLDEGLPHDGEVGASALSTTRDSAVFFPPFILSTGDGRNHSPPPS